MAWRWGQWVNDRSAQPRCRGAMEPAFGREGMLFLRAAGLALLLGIYLVLYLIGMSRYQ